jgi:hypothetical protein
MNNTRNRFGANTPQSTGRRFWVGPHLSRRVFFRTAASVGGYFLMPVRPMETIARAAATPVGKARNCIFIFMQGGPSHIDTFDLKEGAWTPSWMAPTSYGDLRFPQGLFPNLANNISSMAFIRSVRAAAVAHPIMVNWYQLGRNPLSGLAKIAPHIGSVVALELGPKSANRTLPPFFSFNITDSPGAGYLAPENAPFYFSPGGGGLSNTSNPAGGAVFNRRYGMLMDIDSTNRDTGGDYGSAFAAMAPFNLAARKLMYNADVDKIFTFAADERARYGTSQFGNACITARNLLRSNMGTRFIQITLGSWDFHSNIYTVNSTMQALGKQFDTGLGTLMQDLRSDGLLDQTLIVALGEFGRTVGALNSTAGRDHLQQHAVMMAGAGIAGGRAIGSTDSTGSSTADPGWSRKRDVVAEDIEATIYSALGIDWTTVRHDDPLGRGFEYVPQSPLDLYGPINELWR